MECICEESFVFVLPKNGMGEDFNMGLGRDQGYLNGWY